MAPRRPHYTRAVVLLLIALLVLVIGFASGWIVANRNAKRADAAEASRAQAEVNERAVRKYLRQACANDIRSACQMVKGLDAQPSSPLQNALTEIQDPEIQESEIQEPDTYCQDNPIRCVGPAGPPGPVGEGLDGVDGADGDDGVDGAPGRSVTAVTCSDAQNFVINYSDGTSDILTDSDCLAQDGAQGPKGDPGSVQPGDYQCEDGQYVQGFTVNEDGTVVLHCTPKNGPLP